MFNSITPIERERRIKEGVAILLRYNSPVVMGKLLFNRSMKIQVREEDKLILEKLGWKNIIYENESYWDYVEVD